MHIHLEVVGGIAGDMFCAAMLNALPELKTPLIDFLSSIDLTKNYSVSVKDAEQKGLTGYQFQVLKKLNPINDHTHHLLSHTTKHHNHNHNHNHNHTHHEHEHEHEHEHHHYNWDHIQARLKQIEKEADIYQCALSIYTLLLTAESKVHGLELDKVCLHEVGADDALIDIISAAFLIYRGGLKTCSVSSLPWGNGSVRCAHGDIPVPAPATLEILKGFQWYHDEEIGERITPTGAAILAWLINNRPATIQGNLIKIGYGFGTKQFKLKANTLRLTIFDTTSEQIALSHLIYQNDIYMIQCDIDDMSPELLAIAQKQLNQLAGVIEITSQMRLGKKERWCTQLEILCIKEQLTTICEQIFIETSTLGLRFWSVERYILPRESFKQQYQEKSWPVKVAFRPNHETTAKLEADTLNTIETHSQRQQLKSIIENLASDKTCD